MKTLLHIVLILLLAGCASPFRTVYTSPEGDYYLEERSAGGVYYELNSVLYADVGFNPWWVSAYNPLEFVYYSPYFYPHYFSVWYPPAYAPYYGFYAGYYSYWCPPYPVRRLHERPDPGEAADNDQPLPPANNRYVLSQRDLWRSMDNQSLNRMSKAGGGPVYKSFDTPRSMTTFRSAPAKPSASFPASDFGSPSGVSGYMPAARPGIGSVSGRSSGVAPAKSKQ